MVNYENSVIYKLCCTDPTVTEVYVGSTTNFRKRKNQHKEYSILQHWQLNAMHCMAWKVKSSEPANFLTPFVDVVVESDPSSVADCGWPVSD